MIGGFWEKRTRNSDLTIYTVTGVQFIFGEVFRAPRFAAVFDYSVRCTVAAFIFPAVHPIFFSPLLVKISVTNTSSFGRLTLSVEEGGANSDDR